MLKVGVDKNVHVRIYRDIILFLLRREGQESRGPATTTVTARRPVVPSKCHRGHGTILPVPGSCGRHPRGWWLPHQGKLSHVGVFSCRKPTARRTEVPQVRRYVLCCYGIGGLFRSWNIIKLSDSDVTSLSQSGKNCEELAGRQTTATNELPYHEKAGNLTNVKIWLLSAFNPAVLCVY